MGRFEVSIPKTSFDGRWWSLFPQGNAPSPGNLSGAALAALQAQGALSSGGVGDWLLRSAAPGIVKAVAYAQAADVATYAFAGSETTPPSWDAGFAPFGQPGSLKFAIAPGDGAQSGTQKINFLAAANAVGPGGTLWWAFRQHMDLTYAFLLCPTSDGSVQGFKQGIMSGPSSSNQAFEVVWESNLNIGSVLGYNNSANGFNNWEQAYQPPGGLPSDFKFQPSIANDGSAGLIAISPDSVYPFVNGGIDPDTGLAFTASQIEWSRIGGSYLSQSGQVVLTNPSRFDKAFAYGLGHPLSGAMGYPLNQWATYLYRVDVGTFGLANTRLRSWCAPEGLGYTPLADVMVRIDAGTDAGYSTYWPMPYYTNRIAGGVSIASKTSNITGITIVVVGLASALGPGTLLWNAATKTLSWAEAGDSPGPAIGIASWKKKANVTTATGNNSSYAWKGLGILITNYAALPTTNQADTITIQSGRAATQTHMSEFLFSVGAGNPINATAFNAAGVQIGPTGGYPPPGFASTLAGAAIISTTAAAAAAGGSTLASLVAGMNSGNWATWAAGALPNSIDNPAGDDPVISNGSVCNWDSVRKKIMYYGHGHGNDYQSLMLDYPDASNGWINTSGTPIGSGISFPTHQFAGQTANSANGDVYWFYQSGHVFKRAGGATTWTDLGAVPQGVHGQGCGAAFLPQYGTAGGVVFASFYGIDVWDVGAGSWTELSNGSGLSLGDSSQFRQCLGFYDVASQAVYFVSVAGANDKTVYKVAANGTITKKSNAPVTVNVNISSPGQGMCVDGYTTPGAVVRKPLIVVPGSVVWEYTSGSDTWAQVFSGTSPTSTVANFALFIGACLTYDCITLLAQSSSDGSATAFVYKR